MKKKQDVVIDQEKKLTTIGLSPLEQIRELIGKGITPQDLKDFLGVQKDWEANEARKAFAAAFARAQENIGKVAKTKNNPQTRSNYADLNDVLTVAKPIYTKEGFSVIFYEGKRITEGTVLVSADVLHSAGHKENYNYEVPLDGVGLQGNANMTRIHGKASSVSYGRKNLMCMIWNIQTFDDDGNAAGVLVEYIDDKQKNQIIDLLADQNTDIKKFCDYMKIETLAVMPKAKFPQAMIAIENRKKAIEAKKAVGAEK